MLGLDGQVKLADFGWSIMTKLRRNTLCGTVAYLAPEVCFDPYHLSFSLFLPPFPVLIDHCTPTPAKFCQVVKGGKVAQRLPRKARRSSVGGAVAAAPLGVALLSGSSSDQSHVNASSPQVQKDVAQHPGSSSMVLPKMNEITSSSPAKAPASLQLLDY